MTIKPIALILLVALTVRAQSVLYEDYRNMQTNGQTGLAHNVWNGGGNETCAVIGGVFTCTLIGDDPWGIGFFLQTLAVDNSAAYSDTNYDSYMRAYSRETWRTRVNHVRYKFKCSVGIASTSASATGDHWLEVGTYVRLPTDAGEVTETNQGQHYYHHFNPYFDANDWVYIDMNQKPQHKVQDFGDTDYMEDPEYNAPSNRSTVGPWNPVHYYDGMTHFYFGPTYATELRPAGVSCTWDTWTTDTVTNGAEWWVAGVSSAYDSGAGKISVRWQAPKHIVGGVTYDVRYSTASMRTNGWSSGTSAGTALGPDDSPYGATSFLSPTIAKQNTYFAIKPRMTVGSASVSGTVRLAMPTLGTHDLTSGDSVTVSGVCAAANGTRTITVVDIRTVSLNGTSGTCSYSGTGGTITSNENTRNFAEILYGDAASPTAPTITTSSPLPSGTQFSAYSQSITATGDTPITWSLTSGSLPAGLSLSSGGALSGTPSAAGASTFTATATNTTGSDGKSFSLTINAASGTAKVGISGKATIRGRVVF